VRFWAALGWETFPKITEDPGISLLHRAGGFALQNPPLLLLVFGEFLRACARRLRAGRTCLRLHGPEITALRGYFWSGSSTRTARSTLLKGGMM